MNWPARSSSRWSSRMRVGLEQVARLQAVAQAQRGGHADGLAGVGAGGHDAGRAERDVARR